MHLQIPSGNLWALSSKDFGAIHGTQLDLDLICWVFLGGGEVGVWRNLGLPLSAFIFNTLGLFFSLKVTANAFKSVHAVTLLQELCLLWSICWIQVAWPCLVGADSSSQKHVQGPLSYQTKPVPEYLLCWLLLPLNSIRLFPIALKLSEYTAYLSLSRNKKKKKSPKLPHGWARC